MPLNFAASMWWIDRKPNHAKLQPSMLFYHQLTIAKSSCEIWSNISLLRMWYALEYMLLHQYLANCLSFLDVWIQQRKCRRSTWKMMSSRNWQAGCNEAGGAVPHPHFGSTTGERWTTTVWHVELRLPERCETCLNSCSSVVGVYWSWLL